MAGTIGIPSTLPQFAQQTDVLKYRGKIHQDPHQNQCRPEPEGAARGLQRRVLPYRLDFSQEQAEPRNHKSESHHRQSGPDPRQEGSLSR
jgi:hypothetical protein